MILLDLKLSADHDTEGLELCSEIVRRRPQSNVVILSTFLNESLLEPVAASRRQGVRAQRGRPRRARADHPPRVAAGSPGSTGAARRWSGRSWPASAAAASPTSPQREREVTELIANGLTNAEIGRRIFVSESTAKFHVRNVMRKLGVHSRAEVAYAAGKRGLLDRVTSR